MTEKPVYKIPSMNEIANLPKNDYKAISTFSGCGGSCLGFEMAGYTVLWANEFIYEAQRTYQLNHPDVCLTKIDIRQVKPNDIFRVTGLGTGDIDVLEGSPPCADFSMAGKRGGSIETATHKTTGKRKKYSDTVQQVDDLFFEFARILEGVQPKVFVAENVKGLTIGKASILLGSQQADLFGRHEDTIYHALTSCGYNVRYKVLNASDYGVPQSRDRLIFIGVRKDLNIEPTYPDKLSYKYTVSDAIDGLVSPDYELYDASIGEYTDTYRYLTQAKPGESFDKYTTDGTRFGWMRTAPDSPSPTILASQGTSGLFHYKENRFLTVSELKRLHSFPDDFQLTGDFHKQCERIGRSVPPFMMRAIAKTIQEKILDRFYRKNQS